jgi:septin family protein
MAERNFGCPIRLTHTFNALVVGSINTGKTTFVARLLRSLPELIPDVTFAKIIYSYAIWQPTFEKLQKGNYFLFYF